jgi:hypothetical protein
MDKTSNLDIAYHTLLEPAELTDRSLQRVLANVLGHTVVYTFKPVDMNPGH